MEKACETCKRYIPHYVKYDNSKYRRPDNYAVSGAGHCPCPRLKPRWGRTPACQNYKEKPKS